MTDKLTLYNLALAHLRERSLSALTEANEPRRVLDSLYAQVVAECLEEGLWNFMERQIQIDASETQIPNFRWKYAFSIPTDHVRTVMVSSVETFTQPMMDYQEATGFWFANWTPIFVRYLSNDDQYGMNLGKWPATFTRYVALALAEMACGRIPNTLTLLEGPNGISKRMYKAKIKAKANDAMNEPPGQLPTGTWALSRRGFLRGIPLPGGSGYDD